jgi:hypothetical protein
VGFLVGGEKGAKYLLGAVAQAERQRRGRLPVDSKRMTPKPRKDGDDLISRSGVSNKPKIVVCVGATPSA